MAVLEEEHWTATVVILIEPLRCRTCVERLILVPLLVVEAHLLFGEFASPLFIC